MRTRRAVMAHALRVDGRATRDRKLVLRLRTVSLAPAPYCLLTRIAVEPRIGNRRPVQYVGSTAVYRDLPTHTRFTLHSSLS